MKKEMRKTRAYFPVALMLIFIPLLVIPTILLGLHIFTATLPGSGIISSGPTFIISQSDAITNVLNGSSGSTVYSNANANLAFSAAFDCVAAGGTIVVQAGTYTADGSSILMEKCNNVFVKFQPNAILTITDWANKPVFRMSYCANVIVSGIQIDGNGQNQLPVNPTKSHGIELYDCSNCLVTNANITNCRQFGFITGEDNAGNKPNGVTNSIFTFCGWNGISLGWSDNLTTGSYAINNDISYCSDVGISTWGSDGCIITNNYLHDMYGTTGGARSPGWGIAIEYTGRFNLVANNRFVNCGRGVNLGENTQSNIIVNNTLSNCKSGIASGNAGYNVISNNRITNCSGLGRYESAIGVYSQNDIISFNTIETDVTSVSLGHAIFVGDGSSNCSVTNNTVTMPHIDIYSASGVHLSGGASNTLIEGNNIDAYGGIVIDDATSYNNKISQNILTNCTVSISDSGTGTIINPTSSSTYRLHFNIPSANGITVPAQGTHVYADAITTTIMVTPNTGYKAILNVNGADVTLAGNAYTLSMNRDHVVYVIFSRSE